MFSQPLQELCDNSFVIIASTILPIVIDYAKHYERNIRIEQEKQVERSSYKGQKGKYKNRAD